jgi:predicted RNase H-like HicB family nuclease
MKYKNSLDAGSVRVIIFKEKDTWFGVALEFNIVEAGADPHEVILMLDEAMRGYVTSARKSRLRPHVLNQESDSVYEGLWNKLQQHKPIPSPIRVYSFGERSLAML